jgi:hypothetical protein
MTLKAFHVVFIAASALLAFFFAAWCLGSSPPPGVGRTVAGALSAGAGLGLGAYEAWFLRKMSPRMGPSAPGDKRGLP